MKQYALLKLLCAFVFISFSTDAMDGPNPDPSRKRERSVEAVEMMLEPQQKRARGDEVGSEEALPPLMAHYLLSDEPLSSRENAELQNKLKALDAAGDFAIPTTDSGFKHLLSVEPGNEQTVISFLNTFVPTFHTDPVLRVRPAPVAIPPLPYASLKQTFMDVHVVSQSGIHYVIEMQAKRHVYFDERALFYACATYSRQIEEEAFKSPTWYTTLKPVIAIQVLDYDTNRARGIKETDVPDTLIARVKENPLPGGEFMKHYLMTCQKSSQKLDHLQILQIELGRVRANLYPPRQGFSELDWWLSAFKFAGKYTEEYIKTLPEQGIIMPEAIRLAFDRLRYSKWNPREIREYKVDVVDREENLVMLACEISEGREEGERLGLEKGEQIGLEKGEQIGLEKGREEGEKIGLEKGREEGEQKLKETACRLHQKGMGAQDISELTGLSVETVQLLFMGSQ